MGHGSLGAWKNSFWQKTTASRCAPVPGDAVVKPISGVTQWHPFEHHLCRRFGGGVFVPHVKISGVLCVLPHFKTSEVWCFRTVNKYSMNIHQNCLARRVLGLNILGMFMFAFKFTFDFLNIWNMYILLQNTSSFQTEHHLVGGFNPFETYQSNWKSSPNRGEHKKYLSCHHLDHCYIVFP